MQITNTRLELFEIPVPQEIVSKIFGELDLRIILKIAEVNKAWNIQVSSLRDPLLSFTRLPKWFHFKLKRSDDCSSFDCPLDSVNSEDPQDPLYSFMKIDALNIDDVLETLN